MGFNQETLQITYPGPFPFFGRVTSQTVRQWILVNVDGAKRGRDRWTVRVVWKLGFVRYAIVDEGSTRWARPIKIYKRISIEDRLRFVYLRLLSRAMRVYDSTGGRYGK